MGFIFSVYTTGFSRTSLVFALIFAAFVTFISIYYWLKRAPRVGKSDFFGEIDERIDSENYHFELIESNLTALVCSLRFWVCANIFAISEPRFGRAIASWIDVLALRRMIRRGNERYPDKHEFLIYFVGLRDGCYLPRLRLILNWLHHQLRGDDGPPFGNPNLIRVCSRALRRTALLYEKRTFSDKEKLSIVVLSVLCYTNLLDATRAWCQLASKSGSYHGQRKAEAQLQDLCSRGGVLVRKMMVDGHDSPEFVRFLTRTIVPRLLACSPSGSIPQAELNVIVSLLMSHISSRDFLYYETACSSEGSFTKLAKHLSEEEFDTLVSALFGVVSERINQENDESEEGERLAKKFLLAFDGFVLGVLRSSDGPIIEGHDAVWPTNLANRLEEQIAKLNDDSHEVIKDRLEMLCARCARASRANADIRGTLQLLVDGSVIHEGVECEIKNLSTDGARVRFCISPQDGAFDGQLLELIFGGQVTVEFELTHEQEFTAKHAKMVWAEHSDSRNTSMVAGVRFLSSNA